MIQITYSGHYANVSGLTSDQEEVIKDLLSYQLPGAEFATGMKFKLVKGKRRFNPLYNQDPKKYLYELKYKRFPAGLVPKVEELFKAKNWSYEIKGPSLPIATLNGLLDDSRPPRYYQLEAQEAASKTDRGILVLPTGTGKSLLTGLLSRLCTDEKILITVPNLSLLTQTHSELTKFLATDIGIIGDGKQIVERVTVSTIQSMTAYIKANKKQSKDPIGLFIKSCAVWIADECHGAGADSYIALSKRLINCNRRYGLTATAFREDGKELIMEGILGPIKYTYSLDAAMKDKVLTPVDIYMRELPQTKLYGYKPGYSTVYKDNISESISRNSQIMKETKELVNNNFYPCLVIVDQIKHGEFLAKKLNCQFISGKEDESSRAQMLSDFSSGTNKILIGSSVMNVGVDIPTIKSMVNAAGSKSAILLLQRIGRALRKHPSKDRVIFVDYMDNVSPYICDHSKIRKELYNKYFPNRVHQINEHEAIKFSGEDPA